MPKSPVLIHSSWSAATLVSSLAAQHLWLWLYERGLNPIEIMGLSANPFRVARTMNYVKEFQDMPAWVHYTGHGYPDSLAGFELAVPFRRLRAVYGGANDDLFRNCIISTIACYSLRKLGPRLVDAGAVAYMGSTEPMWVGFEEKDKVYLPDFIDVFTVGAKTLATGGTVRDALEAFRTRCRHYIGIYECQQELRHAEYYLGAMEKNLEYYDAIGDLNAKWTEK